MTFLSRHQYIDTKLSTGFHLTLSIFSVQTFKLDFHAYTPPKADKPNSTRITNALTTWASVLYIWRDNPAVQLHVTTLLYKNGPPSGIFYMNTLQLVSYTCMKYTKSNLTNSIALDFIYIHFVCVMFTKIVVQCYGSTTPFSYTKILFF